MQKDILGVDIGGVIIDRANDQTDTSFFSENYLKTTPVPGAFETLKQLAEVRFGSVYLVSKCGRNTQRKTLEWLEYNDFPKLTGIPLERARFCRERHEKAGICEGLGITHFIDDRLEVLGYLASVSERILFRPDAKEVQRFEQHLGSVMQADSWEDVRWMLM